MKLSSKSLLVIASSLFANSLFAQYPSIPADVQKASNDMMKEAGRQSDIAWQKALPIIEKEATQGKPYIPWASHRSAAGIDPGISGRRGWWCLFIWWSWWKSVCSNQLGR
jgi:hypothetical protein